MQTRKQQRLDGLGALERKVTPVLNLNPQALQSVICNVEKAATRTLLHVMVTLR